MAANPVSIEGERYLWDTESFSGWSDVQDNVFKHDLATAQRLSRVSGATVADMARGEFWLAFPSIVEGILTSTWIHRLWLTLTCRLVKL